MSDHKTAVVVPFNRDRALLSVQTDKARLSLSIVDDLRKETVSAIAVTEEALAQKESLLGRTALIGAVRNAAENEEAFKLQVDLQAFIKSAEEGKVSVKKVFWDYCVGIDLLLKLLTQEAKDQLMRLSRLIGNFQAAEEAKARAINNLRKADLDDLEAERQRRLSEANSIEERDMIEHEICDRRASLPMAAPEKLKGQALAWDWELEITDKKEFVANHPDLARVEIKMREAKALLDAGQTLKGVAATKIPKGQARGKRAEAA